MKKLVLGIATLLAATALVLWLRSSERGDATLDSALAMGSQEERDRFERSPEGEASLPQVAEELLRIEAPLPSEIPISARIQLDARRADLRVYAITECQEDLHYVGHTDESGRCQISWSQAAPIRIELRDRNGTLVGSTNAFESFEGGTDTYVLIDCRAGSLYVSATKGVELPEDQALQLLIQDRAHPQDLTRVETVFGHHGSKECPRQKTTPHGLEVKNLRPGTYDLEAIWIEKSEDGRWLPLDHRSKRTFTVHPGERQILALR